MEVYFTLGGANSISLLKCVGGNVIMRENLSWHHPPQHWIDALREMKDSMDIAPINPSDPVNLTTPRLHLIGGSNDCYAGVTDNRDEGIPQSVMTQQDTVNMLLSPMSSSCASVDVRAAFPTPISPFSTERDMLLAPDTQLLPCFPVHTDPVIPPQSSPSIQSPKSSTASVTPNLVSLKRARKLQVTLEKFQSIPVQNIEQYNQQIDSLWNGGRSYHCPQTDSMVQFAVALGRLGNISTTAGTIYRLLSWKIFGMEEERLIREEGMAPNVAAKRMNKQMADVLQHRGKAKDWASDGRRAAKMVFNALRQASTTAKSFALVLLGDIYSLDYLLKIAHFPTLRKSFEEQFSHIVSSRTEEWEFLQTLGYQVFDYEVFLQSRGDALHAVTRLNTTRQINQFDSANTYMPSNASYGMAELHASTLSNTHLLQ